VSPDIKWSVRRGQLKTSTVFESILESSSSLLGVLSGSQAILVMRWTIPGSILIEVVS
jgi:hypothetical protein